MKTDFYEIKAIVNNRWIARIEIYERELADQIFMDLVQRLKDRKDVFVSELGENKILGQYEN